MNYYIGEGEAQIDNSYLKNTAGTKARYDVNSIFVEIIANPILFKIPSAFGLKQNLISKIKRQFISLKIWKEATKNLKSGDRLFIQFPFLVYSVFLAKVFKRLKKRKVELIFLIHDFPWIRESPKKLARKFRISKERKQIKCADKYIIHNKKMADFLVADGISRDRLVELQLFDYLVPDFDKERAQKTTNKDMPIIIAGNLNNRKSKYVYSLPDTCEWNLYGPNYAVQGYNYINYLGSFAPDDLIYNLNGSFGLVWDGDSIETCTGLTGEYLKLNNPHKTSLYLASGIPVIIWKEAALADFIIKNGCGIVVSSLSDIASEISKLTDGQYAEMCENANKIGQKLRDGYFTKKAIEKVLN